MSWNIPHDERHRFLDFGPRDDIFYHWIAWFERKGIAYEIGGSANNWTIYKHWHATDPDTGKTGRCCPMTEPL